MDNRRSRVDLVYDQVIKDLILDKLQPGHFVNRRELAARLGISISPVGEALFQLEMEGLLETIPRKGTRVRQPSQRDVWGMQIVRIALEAEAARMICGQPVSKQYRVLKKKARKVDKARKEEGGLIRSDAAFHRSLIELAGCPALLRHFDMVIRQGLLLIGYKVTTRRSRSSHTELLDALRADDPVKAGQAIREHIQTGKLVYALERGDFAETVKVRFGNAPELVSKRISRSVEQILGE